MCSVCKKAVKLSKKSPQDALDVIGIAMAEGKSAGHFKNVLDEILGTPEPEVNEQADREWENEFGTTTRTNKP